MRKHIPNTITLINLFCGCCALLSVLNGQFVAAFWFLFTGGWADYLDGMAARLLNVKSPLGKELDSMADMVSFGVVPGVILYVLLCIALGKPDFQQWPGSINIYALPAFLVPVFAGLRLAKFNLDVRQTENFLGLSTPSMTVFVTGLMLIYHFDSYGLGQWVINPYFLYGVIVLFSYLLVSEIPMFSFKFKQFKWTGNELRFSFVILAIILMLVLREASFSLIIILYILFSLVGNVWIKTPSSP